MKAADRRDSRRRRQSAFVSVYLALRSRGGHSEIAFKKLLIQLFVRSSRFTALAA